MHIPASMLNGAVCPVTLAVGAAGLGTAAYLAKRSEKKPSAEKFAAITALIFALQMLNFPVQNGTSGHLVGAMLAVSFLGIPFAALSMAIVLAVQAFFFGDGGVNALGANILNMALIAVGLSGWLFNALIKKGLARQAALAMAGWVSVMLAATACAFEVAASGAVSLNKVIPAMLSVHALIGLGEALLTVAVVALLTAGKRIWQENEKSFALGAFGLAIIAAGLSPLASSFPDGLEWVSEKLTFAQFAAFDFPAIFPDYQAAFIANAAWSTVFAGVIGVGIVFAVTYFAGKAIKSLSAI